MANTLAVGLKEDIQCESLFPWDDSDMSELLSTDPSELDPDMEDARSDSRALCAEGRLGRLDIQPI